MEKLYIVKLSLRTNLIFLSLLTATIKDGNREDVKYNKFDCNDIK